MSDAREALAQLRESGMTDPYAMVDALEREHGIGWLAEQTDVREYWTTVAKLLLNAERRLKAPALSARRPQPDWLDAMKAVPRGHGKYEWKTVGDLTLSDCLAIAADYRADEASARREALRFEAYVERMKFEGAVRLRDLKEFRQGTSEVAA